MTRMHWAFLAPELSATSTMLRGWIMAGSPGFSRCPAQDLANAPPLVLRQRTRLLDQDPVADLRHVRLVVGLDPLVARMAVHALDLDHASLGHLVAHHHTFLRLALSHGRSLLLALALELALAEHRPGSREIPLGLLHARRVLRHAHRELETQVEQLLGQLLDLLLQVLAAHVPPARRFHVVFWGGATAAPPPDPPAGSKSPEYRSVLMSASWPSKRPVMRVPGTESRTWS